MLLDSQVALHVPPGLDQLAFQGRLLVLTVAQASTVKGEYLPVKSVHQERSPAHTLQLSAMIVLQATTQAQAHQFVLLVLPEKRPRVRVVHTVHLAEAESIQMREPLLAPIVILENLLALLDPLSVQIVLQGDINQTPDSRFATTVLLALLVSGLLPAISVDLVNTLTAALGRTHALNAPPGNSRTSLVVQTTISPTVAVVLADRSPLLEPQSVPKRVNPVHTKSPLPKVAVSVPLVDFQAHQELLSAQSAPREKHLLREVLNVSHASAGSTVEPERRLAQLVISGHTVLPDLHLARTVKAEGTVLAVPQPVRHALQESTLALKAFRLAQTALLASTLAPRRPAVQIASMATLVQPVSRLVRSVQPARFQLPTTMVVQLVNLVNLALYLRHLCAHLVRRANSQRQQDSQAVLLAPQVHSLVPLQQVAHRAALVVIQRLDRQVALTVRLDSTAMALTCALHVPVESIARHLV